MINIVPDIVVAVTVVVSLVDTIEVVGVTVVVISVAVSVILKY